MDVLTKAVIYNHPQTVRKAKALFDDWMVNKTQLVFTWLLMCAFSAQDQSALTHYNEYLTIAHFWILLGCINLFYINLFYNRVDPKIKQAIYRAGIQYGGQKEWDFCWDQYQKTNVPSEKHHLLFALAMTTDATRLNRQLH